MKTLLVAALCLVGLGVHSTGYTQDATAVLRQFDAEPTVNETQSAALEYAHIDNGRMGNWYWRTRIAALAPEIDGQFTGQTTTDDDVQVRENLARNDDGNLFPTSGYTSAKDDTQERETVRVGAKWDLSNVVFNRDELNVATTIAKQVQLRERILNTVTKIYFERRRLQVEIATGGSLPPAEAVDKKLRLDSLTADLDGLTGGWFSKQLK